MSLARVEADRAGNLKSSVDLTKFGVRGNGNFTVDDSGCGWEWVGVDSVMRIPQVWGRSDELDFYQSRIEYLRNAADDSGRGSVTPVLQVWGRSDELDFYQSRIEYLRNAAEGDGYALNKDSEMNFRRFVSSSSDLRKGSLVLMDNGNIRAIWKDEHGSRLGLQFLGGGMVQYVIFRRREGERQISRAAGRDSVEGIFRQIDAFDLNSLIYE